MKRLLPGEWDVVKFSVVDALGFMEECDATGTLQLGNCRKGDCSVSFDLSSTCLSGSSHSWSETGTYRVEEKGADFLFMRQNPDQTVDTIRYNIPLITSTDLKVSFRNELTNETYKFIFSRN